MSNLDDQQMGFIDPLAINLGNMTTNVAASALVAWNVGATYALDAEVIDTTTRIVYRSVQAGNVGHDPLTEKTWWQNRSVENRLMMFDKSIGSQTTRGDNITTEISPGRVCNHLVLLNADAQQVNVTITDPTDGVVYDEQYPMVRPCGNSWWNYYFTPIERETRLLVSDLPAYSQAVIKVEIVNTGGTAKVGVLVLGRLKRIGNTQWGAAVSFDDWNSKTRDIYGGFDIVERGYSDRIKLPVLIEGPMYDRVVSELVPYRAKALVWVGSPILRSLLGYGYFAQLENVLKNNGISDCNLVIESLT